MSLLGKSQAQIRTRPKCTVNVLTHHKASLRTQEEGKRPKQGATSASEFSTNAESWFNISKLK